MKPTKNKKSLALTTETLRALQDEQLPAAAGGWMTSVDLPCVKTLVSICRICPM